MTEIQTPLAKLAFDEAESILHMTLIRDAVASPETVREHAQAIQQITRERKHCVLIEASNNYVRLDDLNSEMMQLTYKNRVASAYYNPTLAIRLRVMQIKQRSNANVEVFFSKKRALAWLRKAWHKYTEKSV